LAGFENRIKSLINEIKDETVKNYYKKNFFQKLQDLRSIKNYAVNNANTWKKSNLVRISQEILQSERGVNSNDTSNTREKVILLCVIENPRLINDFFEDLGQLNFNKTDFLRLCSFIVEYASNDDKELEKEALKSYLNNSEFSNIVGEIYKDELLRTYRTLLDSDYETLKFTFLELLNLQNKFTANTQLEDAEALLAENMDDASFEKFLKLKKDSLTKES
jgi:hypothetical protein